MLSFQSVLSFPPWGEKPCPPKGLPGLNLWLPTVGAAWLGLALDSTAAFLNLGVETPMGCKSDIGITDPLQ